LIFIPVSTYPGIRKPVYFAKNNTLLSVPTTANPIGSPFIELQSVDSTNKYAMNLVHEAMAQHGMAVFAHHQTAGKGQRGKLWESEKNTGIAMSLILNPFPLQVSEQFKLSMCVAVSAWQWFSALAGNETKIKWPNDLYWRDRKAGGILIENLLQSHESGNATWKWSVVGIGININQTGFPADLPNPVSLKQISGKTYNPAGLSKDLCHVLEKNFQLLGKGESALLFKQYREQLYKKGEKVRLKKGSRIFEAVIKDVSDNGQLITQHALEEYFGFGEIEWLL
jgi:BirA family transcriptional regulator, biotin operon repressor / biotin---[acetyl-CoA-carboxylase] ligase